MNIIDNLLRCYMTIIMVAITNPIKSQNSLFDGMYEHRTFYNNSLMGVTSINLKHNGTFEYHIVSDMQTTRLNGNWQIRQDSILVLDSNPQQFTCLICPMSKKKKKPKHIRFEIVDQNNFPVSYDIMTIAKTDTVVHKFDIRHYPMKMNFDFDTFCLIDYSGKRLPIYNITMKERYCSLFKIVVNTTLTFSDEHWIIQKDCIQPKDFNGKPTGYTLKKIE